MLNYTSYGLKNHWAKGFLNYSVQWGRAIDMFGRRVQKSTSCIELSIPFTKGTLAAGWALLFLVLVGFSWESEIWGEGGEGSKITKTAGVWFSLESSKLPLIKSKCFPCVKIDCFHQSPGRLQNESPSFWCLHPFGSGTNIFLKLLLYIFCLLSASSFAPICRRRSKHRCWVKFQRHHSRVVFLFSPLCLSQFISQINRKLSLSLLFHINTWPTDEKENMTRIRGREVWSCKWLLKSVHLPQQLLSLGLGIIPSISKVSNISAEHILWSLWDKEGAACHCSFHDHFLELQVSATH